IDVEGWYDAGKLDTLLETNRIMLEKGRARRPKTAAGATIIDPVYIEEGVRLSASTVGPNVCLGAGTVVEGSTVRDTIVGTKARIAGATLVNSLMGDEAIVGGGGGEVPLADYSEVGGTPAARPSGKRAVTRSAARKPVRKTAAKRGSAG